MSKPKQQYTPEEIVSDIMGCIHNNDFVGFCRWIKIRDDEGNIFSFAYENWNPGQVLFERDRCGRDIVLKSRQVGFSTLEMIRSLFFALANPNTNTLMITYSNKHTAMLMSKLKWVYNELTKFFSEIGYPNLFPDLTDKTKKGLKSTQYEIILPSQSSIQAVCAGEKEDRASLCGRGNTYQRIWASEAAFYYYPELTMASVLPALSKNGEIVVESTPNGFGDWFYNQIQLSKTKQSSFKLHFYPWYSHISNRMKLNVGEKINPENEDEKKLIENYTINEAQLKWYKYQLLLANGSINKRRIEHPNDTESCFIASGNMFLTSDMRAAIEETIINEPIDEIEMCYGAEYKPLRIWEELQSGVSYLIGADVAGGGGADDSAAVVVNASTGRIVATYSNSRIEPRAFANLLEDLGIKYNKAMLVVETNGPGGACLTHLVDYSNMYDGEFRGHNGGWHQHTKSKPMAFSMFYSQLQDKELSHFPRDVAAQLYICSRDEKGSVAARGKKGKQSKNDNDPKDDLVIAFAIANYARTELYCSNESINLSDAILWYKKKDDFYGLVRDGFGAGTNRSSARSDQSDRNAPRNLFR